MSVPFRPRAARGTLPHEPLIYGRSVQDRPLEVWRPRNEGEAQVPLLVVAGIHGEEPETTVALSSALRSIEVDALRGAAVLCANPDGAARGTRGNVRGVELNRNFPSADWSSSPPAHKFTRGDPQDVRLSPGPRPGSEPETRALMALVSRMRPDTVVVLHAPLACIIDPQESAMGRWLARVGELPLQATSGSPTPGTFDSWLREQTTATAITFELPVCSKDDAMVRYLPLFAALLTGAAGQ